MVFWGNTVAFGTNAVVFLVIKAVFGANPVVFWANSVGVSETVQRGKRKQGGYRFKIYQKQHTVNNMNCDCPEMVPPEFPLIIPLNHKERHMKVKHLNWHWCEPCINSFETGAELKHNLETHEMWINTKYLNTKIVTKLHMLCPECGEYRVSKEQNYFFQVRFNQKSFDETPVG